MEAWTGTCHCGGVEFEVELANGFENVRRCNCSICSRKDAVMAAVMSTVGPTGASNGAAQSLVAAQSIIQSDGFGAA